MGERLLSGTGAAAAFDPLRTFRWPHQTSPIKLHLMVLVVPFLLGSALFAASEHASWPLAEAAFEANCPRAEQEELIACAYKLIEHSDVHIRQELCRTSPATCDKDFSTFVEKRAGRIRRTLGREGSVTSQLEAAWTALEGTLQFERKATSATERNR